MEKHEWKTNTTKHAWGSNMHMGRIVVGNTYRESGSKSDGPETKRWCALCYLPGIKRAEERYLTEAEAMLRVERQVEAWFSFIKG